jgi:hypothetical protein
MSLRIYLINIVFLVFLIPVKAQEPTKDISRVLQDLYYWILNSTSDSERMRLNDSVILLVNSYVASDSVMKHRFDNVRNLGQIDSPDGKLKIINWNLVLRDGSNRYYLYIIRSGGKKGHNIVYKLTGTNSIKPIRTNLIYTPENWYGAAYYAIQPFKVRKNVSYLLLGIDFGNTFTTRKIIDVLSFDEKGDILFGRECFRKGDETLSREVLEYSSDGLVSLRIQSRKLVVFDHLDSFSSGHGDSPESVGAGLYFDGYALKKGVWNYVSNIQIKNRK